MSDSDVMSTFTGRYMHFVQTTDPRNLMHSDAEISKAVALLKVKDSGSSSERKEAQDVVNASINHANGELIPVLFRVSAITPVNIPLIAAMLACPPSNVPVTLFLHFLNQSYNSATNYAHRASAEVDWNALGTSYALAVTSACGIAYGLGKAAERAPPSMAKLALLIPMMATCSANIANLAFTRSGELTQGTVLTDKDGVDRGKSVKAGIDGIAKTALGRGVLVPISCLLLPPIMVEGLRRAKMLPKGKVPMLAVNCICIGFSLQCMLPAALGVFPPRSTFKVEDLEPQFRSLKDKSGAPVRELYSSKGL